MTASHRNPAVQWPFWLLIVAWVCANSPQAATYALVTWIGAARHFSHQQRLTAEVASVLTGAPAPEMRATSEPERPFSPPVPAEATLKKIELSSERTADVLSPAERKEMHVRPAMTWPEMRSEAPPHEPPRVS